MKTKFLLLASAVLGLASCTTAYKTGQTPDDVYYSPTRTIGSDEAREEERRREDDRYYAYEDQGDRYLRYRVRDRRWNALDDDFWRFGYNTYGFNYTPFNNPYYFNNGFGPGFGNPRFNNNFNPYCPFPVGPANPTFGNGYGYTPPRVFKPRSGGLGGYNGGDYNNGNVNGGKPGSGQRPIRLYGNRNYNNSNNIGSGLGESIRKVFSGSGNSNSNSNGNDRPIRSYDPSPSNNNGGGNNNSGGSRSGGGSGGGGGISRPARSGGR